jgi:predicted membrane protein
MIHKFVILKSNTSLLNITNLWLARNYTMSGTLSLREIKLKDKMIHKRGLIAFLTLSGFLIMVLTGIILYITPHGRIAYRVDWHFIGLTKVQWGNIHIISALLFLIAGIFHIYYNWKPLVNYIFNKVSGGLKLKKEMAITAGLSFVIFFSAIFQLPPLKYVTDLNEYVKESWIISREYEPPFGHAERLSLEVFTKKMKIDLDKALLELEENGIKVKNVKDSLEKIAKANKTSPMKLYTVIKKFEGKRKKTKRGFYTPETVEEQFAGTGVGRKTLLQICGEVGEDIVVAQKKLLKHNIQVKDDELLKDIANRYDLYPIDILKIILADN